MERINSYPEPNEPETEVLQNPEPSEPSEISSDSPGHIDFIPTTQAELRASGRNDGHARSAIFPGGYYGS